VFNELNGQGKAGWGIPNVDSLKKTIGADVDKILGYF
jgi:hypothetical protein